ncbi:unnamed protein product [Schistocephalus solidus]|uniref:Uncharacterized protein n=1 Tax=Schistocephalus solidus TaxID=70667 RepID=A0A3P7CYI9_SCHSO|nr:unnamed protein product [Schistocephalus solidus]
MVALGGLNVPVSTDYTVWECWVPTEFAAPTKRAPFSNEPVRRTPPPHEKHFIPLSGAGEDNLDAPRSLHWQLLDYVLVRRRSATQMDERINASSCP